MADGPRARSDSPAIEGCLEACRRCRVLVEAVRAEERSLAHRAYQAIGPHLRHCLDHFHSFLRGLETGVVDYDDRDRDERLERDASQALATLDSITARMEALDPAHVRPLTMRQEPAPGASAQTVPTSLERELLFLSSHTIHHIASMSLLAASAGISMPRELGVAFSTASWERRMAVPKPS